jgi:hypothetical protein
MSATVSATFEPVANVTSRATVRTHRIIVDRGIAKGGSDEGPSGGEYLLVGLIGTVGGHRDYVARQAASDQEHQLPRAS